jgi:4,5-DOPA dioxygenase extradiol
LGRSSSFRYWHINATEVTGTPAPRTIHDFYGFTEKLFAVDYPALLCGTVAEEAVEVVKLNVSPARP